MTKTLKLWRVLAMSSAPLSAADITLRFDGRPMTQSIQALRRSESIKQKNFNGKACYVAVSWHGLTLEMMREMLEAKSEK